MAHFRRKQNLTRLTPEKKIVHLLLCKWSEYAERYAALHHIPIEQVGTGGLMANKKRRKIFPIPLDVQRVDLAVAALNRSDRVLGKYLYATYMGVGLYVDRAEAMFTGELNFKRHSIRARDAVAIAFHMLKSRDLLGRAVLLLSKDNEKT